MNSGDRLPGGACKFHCIRGTCNYDIFLGQVSHIFRHSFQKCNRETRQKRFK